jgi:flagellar motility protein MotE (MotC chaperone)
MMRFVHEFRLIPVVLLATISLLGLKVLGLMLEGGFTLADLDFSSTANDVVVDTASPQRSANGDSLADRGSKDQGSKDRGSKSWARDMFNFPDVTGAIDSDKQTVDKKAGGNAPPPAVRPADTKPADAKPPEAKPGEAGPPAVTIIHPDANAITSPAERAILERLGERRQELDARARELEIRENLVKSAEKKLDGRANEIKGMESQLTGAQQKKDEEAAARLKGLVTMYENMKAKDAAKIFDRLEMPVLIAVVSQINPRRMADIMAQMQTDTAERLTVELASRATGIAASEPAAELPKIEGRPR